MFPNPGQLGNNSPRKWCCLHDAPSQEFYPRCLGSITKQWMSCMNSSLAVGWRPDLWLLHSEAMTFFFFLNFLSPPHPPFWPHLRGCGILVPNQELNPCPLQWKCEVFTGLLGKSQSHELLRNGSFLVDSVQLSHSVVSNSLWPHEQQHARPPYPSPTAGVYPNPCSLCWWCHPTISSSVVPFSSCPQSFPASGSFQMSQLFASGGQSTGVSASTSVLPMNTQDWSPLEWTGWISWQSKGLSRVFSNTIVQKHQVFGPQLSSQSNSHIHTWPLEKP